MCALQVGRRGVDVRSLGLDGHLEVLVLEGVWVDGCAEIEPVPAFNFFNFEKKKFRAKLSEKSIKNTKGTKGLPQPPQIQFAPSRRRLEGVRDPLLSRSTSLDAGDQGAHRVMRAGKRGALGDKEVQGFLGPRPPRGPS